MADQTAARKHWEWEIKPESFWFNWNLLQLWNYRHLLLRLVRRDFLIHHQQTLLGPLWILFQPLIVLVTYILIFEKAVGLSTDGLSPTLFYLSGIILWNLFAESFTATAFTFIQNGALFGKVYFPRLTMPLSSIIVNLVRFGIQFSVFIILLTMISPARFVDGTLQMIFALCWSIPFVAMLGLALGLIFSILTAKYRDLVNIIHLIVRLLMFATPIIYPLSMVGTSWRKYVLLNPLTTMVEVFRSGFLGQGTFNSTHIFYSSILTIVLLFIGSMLFNKYSSKLQDVL
jgi:lipopolysaccharide transport system permease protein